MRKLIRKNQFYLDITIMVFSKLVLLKVLFS